MERESRCILHCDLNNFFASVECLSNPQWREVPMAVCGDTDQRHGIVLAKNEPAKKYGIKTGDTVWQAKEKCAGVIIAPTHFDRYVFYSKEIRKIYGRYTDMIEPFGLDECWLDVGGSRRLFGSGEQIADMIRRDTKNELGLTVSVGVSFNKVFAKLGSDMKKPDAVTVISESDFKNKIWGLPIGDLLFAGRSTVKKLSSSGVFTIGDMAQMSVSSAKKLLGKNGVTLWRYANGFDDSPVASADAEPIRKSIGRSTTGKSDLTNDTQIKRVVMLLCEDVSKRLRMLSLSAGVISVYMRDFRLFVQTHQKRLLVPTRLCKELTDEAMCLITENWDNTPLRSVGVSVSDLRGDTSALQYSFYRDQVRCERLEKIDFQVDSIRNRFGENALRRASLINPMADLSGGGEHCSFSYINSR